MQALVSFYGYLLSQYRFQILGLLSGAISYIIRTNFLIIP